MGKFFPATVRHAKAWEFLKLKQGTMTVMEYVAKFTELARFTDDYVATDLAKVHGVSELWVLVRRWRISLLLVRKRGRRLLLLECFRDEAVAIRAKAKPGFLASQDR